MNRSLITQLTVKEYFSTALPVTWKSTRTSGPPGKDRRAAGRPCAQTRLVHEGLSSASFDMDFDKHMEAISRHVARGRLAPGGILLKRAIRKSPRSEAELGAASALMGGPNGHARSTITAHHRGVLSASALERARAPMPYMDM